jgi:hypothetical protein
VEVCFAMHLYHLHSIYEDLWALEVGFVCLEVCLGMHLRTYSIAKPIAFCKALETYIAAEVRSATHLRAMCTVFTTTSAHWRWAVFVWRCALEHTSAHIVSQKLLRSDKNWKRKSRRRCALRHTSVRSAQYLRVVMCFGGAPRLGTL